MSTSKSRNTRSRSRKPKERRVSVVIASALERPVRAEINKPLDVEYAEVATRVVPEVHAECDNLDIIVNGILADVKALSDRLHPVLIPKPILPTTKLEEAQALSPIGARVQDTARRAGAAHASVRAILESLAV